ncbi:MAG: SHOCT domain-containing protein [Gammaproteobacteria bacterium]
MINDMAGFGGWGMGFGWLFMLLFWGLVILGIVSLIKWLSTGNRNANLPPQQRPKTALEILEERYARGEIEREEFEQKKRDLNQ